MEENEETENERIKKQIPCFLPNHDFDKYLKGVDIPHENYSKGGRFELSENNEIGNDSLSGLLYLRINSDINAIVLNLPDIYTLITKDSITKESNRITIDYGNYFLFYKAVNQYFVYELLDVNEDNIFNLKLKSII